MSDIVTPAAALPVSSEINPAFMAPNGPLIANGDVTVVTEAETRTLPKVSLCRCGASARKPYCDGTHRTSGWADPGEATLADPLGEKLESGPVVFTPLTDGPLQAKGPLTLQTAAKQNIAYTTESYLCRCGASANKPYCDGSHTAIGFKG